MQDSNKTSRSVSYVNRGATVPRDEHPSDNLSSPDRIEPSITVLETPAPMPPPEGTFESQLATRPSWIDAATALDVIVKGKADGNKLSLRLRCKLQGLLFRLGCWIQENCGKVLFVLVLLLSLCCVGLKAVKLETDLEKLWVEADGRLQKELDYVKVTQSDGTGSSSEVLIQTSGNVLTTKSLLLHYQALLMATQVTTTLYGREWSFSDLCVKPSFPIFEQNYLDTMFNEISPCLIITVLDCFWEGGKLLDSRPPVIVSDQTAYATSFSWATDDPMGLLNNLKPLMAGTLYEGLQNFLTRAGITGYTKKPCLDHTDPDCPNKNLTNLDIGKIVTGGCHGLASNFMDWPEDLLFGATQKDINGKIISAEAMQSVILLMAEKDFYNYLEQNKYTLQITPSEVAARQILQAWQEEFTQKIEMLKNRQGFSSDSFYPLTSSSIFTLLKNYSSMNTVLIVLGSFLLMAYVCLCLIRWSKPVQSQVGIGAAGVLLLVLAIAGGLGICAVIRVPFNVLTTQIIPFLALGLGVDNMFILAQSFSYYSSLQNSIHVKEVTGLVLKTSGVPILITSIFLIQSFFIAAIVPIPALRDFSIQAAIIILFCLVTNLVAFTAVVSLDLIRRDQGRCDVLCCFTGDSSSSNNPELVTPGSRTTSSRDSSPPPPYNVARKLQAVSKTDPDGQHPCTVLDVEGQFERPTSSRRSHDESSQAPSTSSSRQCLTVDQADSPDTVLRGLQRCWSMRSKWCLSWFINTYCSPLLNHTAIRAFLLVTFCIMLGLGIAGTIQMKDGLDLTDVLPKDSVEYKSLSAQSQFFGFYNIFIVTKAMDYPGNQRALFDLHSNFQRVSRIIKNSGTGAVPDFWLITFRDWLKDAQMAFDSDWATGCINQTGFLPCATDRGKLGYTLLLQTGDIQSYDKGRLMSGRLVTSDGLIDSRAFYTYLTAWYSNDAIAASAMQPGFYPQPPEWFFESEDANIVNLRIEKSQPLQYAQMPFQLHDCGSSQNIIETIREIRQICEEFVPQGVDNFPLGLPFTYWEQYFTLRLYLVVALAAMCVGIFIVTAIIFVNLAIALTVMVFSVVTVVEVFGFMGWIGLGLNAVTVVLLVISAGLCTHYIIHLVMNFMTIIGSRYERVSKSLMYIGSPVVHGGASTILGAVMLAFAHFDFIVKNFFLVLVVLVIVSVLNGLIFLPVFLCICGPVTEVVPADNGTFLSLPTPPPSPKPKIKVKTSKPRKSYRPSRRNYPLRPVPSDISLSTITEEPSHISTSSSDSQRCMTTKDIIISPKFTVEAVSSSSPEESDTSSCSSAASTPPPAPRHMRTKIKATATFNVEVNTPTTSSAEFKRKKRKEPREHKTKEEDESCV